MSAGSNKGKVPSLRLGTGTRYNHWSTERARASTPGLHSLAIYLHFSDQIVHLHAAHSHATELAAACIAYGVVATSQ